MHAAAPELTTIGILGAGRVGTAVARQALAAGFTVKIATASPASEIEMIVDIVTPGAVAVDASDIATTDLVVIAVPLHKFRTLDPQLLAGKTVIDAMNYWALTDGTIDDFEDDPRTSSEVIQEFLAKSRVVKSLNHIGYHELETDGSQPGTPDRRALALAGAFHDSKGLVATFIHRLGYDPVDAGPLAAGRAFQPSTEIFNGSHTKAQMHELLTAALSPAHA